jgi:hypothetical protein
MVAQERANRILAAWVSGNAERLRLEFDGVLASSRANAPASTVENEEQELLESVVSHLRLWMVQMHTAAGERLQPDLALLRHLSQRSAGSCLKTGCTA